jgi:hypothetical protein
MQSTLSSLVLLLLLPMLSDHHSPAQPPRKYTRQPVGNQYAFINYDANSIHYSQNNGMNMFCERIRGVLGSGSGKINIVHIGDSHIQADYFSGKLRQLLQQTFGNAGRGFVFPYRLAKTNTPESYKLKFTGVWQNCKSLHSNPCILGISNISATTYQSSSSIHINPNTAELFNYDFSTLRLLYDNNEFSFTPTFTDSDTALVLFSEVSRGDGFAEFRFAQPQPMMHMKFEQYDSSQSFFQLYGISLENDEPGILYHAIGLNGAEVKSYLKCDLYQKHLEVLSPHLLIISLGTNDAFLNNFDTAEFRVNYETLIRNTYAANPHAAILLTTPGDIYNARRYNNANMPMIRKILLELGEKYHCGVWDFYEIMGGATSMKTWQRNGLAQGDMVHLTIPGYEVQAELLYKALMDTYEARSDD